MAVTVLYRLLVRGGTPLCESRWVSTTLVARCVEGSCASGGAKQHGMRGVWRRVCAEPTSILDGLAALAPLKDLSGKALAFEWPCSAASEGKVQGCPGQPSVLWIDNCASFEGGLLRPLPILVSRHH